MRRVNQLTLRNAEATALDLSDRGEKWGAHAITSLLAIIEELSPDSRVEFSDKMAKRSIDAVNHESWRAKH